MTIKIGINGFGRIGRGVLRALFERGEKTLQVVAINDLFPAEKNAHLLKYDSVHGRFSGKVSATENSLTVNGQNIKMTAERDPSQIPWKNLGADLILECTGLFTDAEKAKLHFQAGAKKVLISAPATNEDLTIAMGINQESYDPSKHHILSNASCTTNCLAPVAKVLHENFKIQYGLMTTIHSYTNDQCILDAGHKDLRRARAGAVSQIPTSTGAAKAIGLVLPDLKGKLDGMAIRVPTPNVSCVDLVVQIQKSTNAEEVNSVLEKASLETLKGILAFTMEPLVSCDFNGDPHSSIVDGASTKVLGGNLVKILAWYDNETGFSHRLLDLAKYVGERL